MTKKKKHKKKKKHTKLRTQNVQNQTQHSKQQTNSAVNTEPNIKANKTTKKDESYKLPVSEIKKDVTKTLLFGIFAVVLLVGLSLAEISVQDITSTINGLL